MNSSHKSSSSVPGAVANSAPFLWSHLNEPLNLLKSFLKSFSFAAFTLSWTSSLASRTHRSYPSVLFLPTQAPIACVEVGTEETALGF